MLFRNKAHLVFIAAINFEQVLWGPRDTQNA